MQEKVYIESTDEITDVIERLHIARTPNVVFFVPQRALLLQSSINLRLLQREAQKMQKNISLVTQDADGAVLAEKIGLTVETVESFDDYNQQEAIQAQIQTQGQMQEPVLSPIAPGAPIGSETFIPGQSTPSNPQNSGRGDMDMRVNRSMDAVPQNTPPQAQQQVPQSQPQSQQIEDIDTLREASQQGAAQKPLQQLPQQVSPQQQQAQEQLQNDGVPYIAQAMPVAAPSQPVNTNAKTPRQTSQDAISDFFTREVDYGNDHKQQSQPWAQRPSATKPHKESHRSLARMGKFFIAAGIILSLFAICFVVLPKTDVTLTRERVTLSSNLTIEARTDAGSVDIERRIIPAQMVAFDATYTERFDATGAVERSDRKARGVITISNTFSTAAQPLVATTRFTAANGKLFRLIEGVTVPGVSTVDGKQEPGIITAEVVADEAGESFNIAPTTFTIPGLKGSDKFTKITAASPQPMRGGGAQDGKTAVVSQDDITKAKDVMNTKRAAMLREQIAARIAQRGGGIFLEDTIEHGTAREQASVAAQTAVEEFDYTVTIPVRVMVFAQDDVYSIMESAIAKKESEGSASTVEGELTIDYGDAETRYGEGILEVDVDGSGTFVSDIDAAAVHADLRGKRVSEIEAMMRESYPGVERLDLNFTPRSPQFFSRRISPVSAMLNVDVQ